MGATRKLARALGAPLEAMGLDMGYNPLEDVTNPETLGMLEQAIDAQLIEHLWIAVPCESVSIMWTQDQSLKKGLHDN